MFLTSIQRNISKSKESRAPMRNAAKRVGHKLQIKQSKKQIYARAFFGVKDHWLVKPHVSINSGWNGNQRNWAGAQNDALCVCAQKNPPANNQITTFGVLRNTWVQYLSYCDTTESTRRIKEHACSRSILEFTDELQTSFGSQVILFKAKWQLTRALYENDAVTCM